ncbi:MAG TPA: M3 family metallopeptidase [Candidatus Binatia bacterium]|nr:M3 family metallopeptidase [Candidatus Binatia bacterium]
MSTTAVADDNPLLSERGLPQFDRIRPEHVVPGMRSLLAELSTELERIEAGATPTWQGAVAPVERLGERLGRAWGVVGHLMGVKNSDDLRRAHDEMQPEVVTFSMRLGQSRPLFRALKGLREGPVFGELDAAQRRIVDTLIRDAELSGVGLEGAAQERFNAIQTELAECSTRFTNNVLDATKAFALTLTAADEVAGLPTSLLELAAQSARQAGHADATAEAGPWRITLDAPSYGPFLQHSRRRDLRERLYRAFVTRAAGGDHDNRELVRRILRLRREEASILGFPSYAELSLASKMAPDVATVERMLEELRAAAWDPAHRDLADLVALARSDGAPEADGLSPWDVAFWAERLRERRFRYSDEELRPYFPLARVLDGLFALVGRLFGVTVEAADGEAPIWHDDVRFFRIRDESGAEIAAFYLDPYSRPAEKRGGAWMDECIGRAPGRRPVAYLVCNQVPPVAGKPSLMTFSEVETLFHEFGHGLQHMLTRVDYPLAAGIRNVEWDAVELPSQFMENWCYHRQTLAGVSGHFETRAPLPDDLFEKIRAARTFRSGSDMLRQLYFAFTDLALHHGYDPDGPESPYDVQRRIAVRTTTLPLLPEDAMLCSFTHVFAGGYAAGYYSYKWAEVLSADAFAAFEEAGLDDDAAIAATGRRYRDTVLALGGSRHPLEVFKEFRGRAPTTDALLRHAGLLAA